MRSRTIVIVLVVVGIAGLAYAGLNQSLQHEPVDFYPGHSHLEGSTHGAPSHSGGTDRFGCHNGSVPYHCH